jgi:hypothetical protein
MTGNKRTIPRICRACGGSSSYRGVSWHKARGQWAATVGNKHIGLYTSESEAAEAAREARSRLLPYTLD